MYYCASYNVAIKPCFRQFILLHMLPTCTLLIGTNKIKKEPQDKRDNAQYFNPDHLLHRCTTLQVVYATYMQIVYDECHIYTDYMRYIISGPESCPGVQKLHSALNHQFPTSLCITTYFYLCTISHHNKDYLRSLQDFPISY